MIIPGSPGWGSDEGINTWIDEGGINYGYAYAFHTTIQSESAREGRKIFWRMIGNGIEASDFQSPIYGPQTRVNDTRELSGHGYLDESGKYTFHIHLLPI